MLFHYILHITCIISCQYPQAIPPLFRANAFQVAIFNMPSEPALKALYASYGQMFDSYNVFKKHVMTETGNYKFILYDARNGTATVEGRYKTLKCPKNIPDFKLRFLDSA